MKVFSTLRASFEQWYLPLVLCLWGLAPGLRRIIDWQFGRNPLSILSVLPMLSLLPLAMYVYRNASSPRLRLPFKTLAYMWLFGFVYALVVALASGGRAGAFYDFAQFCVPMLIGAWIIMRPACRAESFRQLSSTLLWLSIVESAYGVYQFVSPPPWDVAYVNDLHQVSLGLAQPFGLHPFSMLNSHGTLSIFLVAVTLLNLHRLDLRRPWPLAATILNITVLVLTNVRSSWLALVVGVAVYLALSPKRGKLVFALGAVAMVSVAVVLNASALFGNEDVTTQLQQRFDTLGEVDQDASVTARADETSFALHQGLAEPLGQGLGTVGTAVWLNGGDGGDAKVSSLVLDNGYLSRFLEMGVPGVVGYVATLIFSAIFGVRAYLFGLRTKNEVLVQTAIAGLSLQAALMGLDLSSDFHSALPGLFFWLVVGLSLRQEAGDDEARAEWSVDRGGLAGSRNGPLWA